MNIQALKYEIIEWITKTNDSALLQVLKSVKDSDVSHENWFGNLSADEIESINRGIENHKKGEILTSKQFWAGDEDRI